MDFGFAPQALTMQAAIERMDSEEEDFRLAVCDYRGKSLSLIRLFLELSTNCPVILFHDYSPGNFEDIFRFAPLAELKKGDMAGFARSAGKFRAAAGDEYAADSGFFRIAAAGLKLSRPLPADIYIRLGANHYCKRFRSTDGFSQSDLEEHFQGAGLEFFFVRKNQAEELVRSRSREIETLLEKELPREAVMEAASESLHVVHNLVTQIGFTPRTEELAKNTVKLVLQSIERNPALMEITQKLRIDEGKYISAHSVMLAELACAVAYRIGWASASVFMKLTLSAFLHDISLDDQRLARMRILHGMTEAKGFSLAMKDKVRLHPIKGAELAKKFRDIPADVDTIISQHHESPDGQGFPRGLFAHQINPLASIFIVAHDLLDFHLGRNPSDSSQPSLEAFLEAKRDSYEQGSFRKISESLKTGSAFRI